MKIFKRKSITILLIFSLFMLISSIWQNYMMKCEVKMYSPKGNIYNINDHKMHLYGTGEGEYTVVFISGSGTPCSYTDFYYLQKDLSQYAKVVSFDHAGYGWSEQTDKARDIDTIVDELHLLLDSAGKSPPYILVAHSIGSLEAIHYAQKYGNDVKGIVLLDGGNPYFYANDSQLSAIAINRFEAFIRALGIVRGFGEIGVFFPFTFENIRYKMLPDNLKNLDKVMYYNKIGDASNIQFINNINKNAKSVISSGYLSGTPLHILSAESSGDWEKSQKELMLWSDISYQETVPKENHYIHWSYRSFVVEKIKKLIK